jgi:hypothetical protein
MEEALFLLEEHHLLEARGSLYCYPVRIELVCERNTCNLKVFWSGRIIPFIKKYPLQKKWRNACFLHLIILYYILLYLTICVRECFAHCSLWELRYLLKGILHPSVFSIGGDIPFGPNSPIQVNGRITVCLGRKSCMQKQEGLPHCFPVRIELACDRNTCDQKAFFKNFFYSNLHTMFGSFLPSSSSPLPFPHSLSLPPTPSLPGRNYFALISIFVEERV